ncbi:MAG: helix-turn-helix transcriptional regulator [Flavobacteriaceae bacterium]
MLKEMTLQNPIQERLDILLKKIKTTRIKKEITQYEMSERLNISQNSYYKIEKGKTKLDIYRLLQISYILEFNFAELIEVSFSD